MDVRNDAYSTHMTRTTVESILESGVTTMMDTGKWTAYANDAYGTQMTRTEPTPSNAQGLHSHWRSGALGAAPKAARTALG